MGELSVAASYMSHDDALCVPRCAGGSDALVSTRLSNAERRYSSLKELARSVQFSIVDMA